MPKAHIDHDLRLQMEATGRAIAERIGVDLPKGIGFTLLLYQFGPGGWLNYISNGRREDVVKAMEEFIRENRHGEKDILGPGH